MLAPVTFLAKLNVAHPTVFSGRSIIMTPFVKCTVVNLATTLPLTFFTSQMRLAIIFGTTFLPLLEEDITYFTVKIWCVRNSKLVLREGQLLVEL